MLRWPLATFKVLCLFRAYTTLLTVVLGNNSGDSISMRMILNSQAVLLLNCSACYSRPSRKCSLGFWLMSSSWIIENWIFAGEHSTATETVSFWTVLIFQSGWLIVEVAESVRHLVVAFDSAVYLTIIMSMVFSNRNTVHVRVSLTQNLA